MSPILHVITSKAWGGLEMYVATLIKEQAEHGLTVEAYCLRETPIERELQKAGVKIHFAHKESHFSFRDILAVRRIARRGKIGVVHSHTRYDVWTCSLALLGSNVAHVHSTYMVVAPKKDLHHWFIYRRVDAITSSSSFANQKIAEGMPIAKEKIKLIRYGRELDRFVRSEEVRTRVRKELGIAEAAIVFGIVGRIEPLKGIREFAESLLELAPAIRSRVYYFVIGEEDRAAFEEFGAWFASFKNRSDVRDQFKVIPFQKDIVPYLNALDCLVLASYAEMYSLSVLEAMAMSLPVIGTNSEGTPEQVPDGVRGLLVEPHSAKSIADAVTKYVLHPELLQKHGEAGNAWVRAEHPMDRTIAEYKKLYRSVIEARMGRA